MKTPLRCCAAALSAAVVGSVLLATPAQAAPVTITLVDINDFHGRIDANTVKFAGTVEQIRAQGGEDNTLFLSAGDNIGASLFASATQQDAPTIDVLNALDLDASAVGNHEFDRGVDDLLGRVEERSDFPHLAANVIDSTTGESILPGSATFEVGGLDVAVIGVVTEETPTLVSPDGVAGLEFTDPVEAVNDEVAELQASADAPDVIVASFHEGAGAGTPDGSSLAQEVAAGGVFAEIVNETSPEVDAIFTGHTHKQYAWDAPVPGVAGKTRPIVQTGNYGEFVGKVTLTVESTTGAVTAHTAQNVARSTTADATLVSTYPRVAAVKTIVDAALANAETVGRVPVGEITENITTAYTANGTTRDDRANESTLGNLVAEMFRDRVSRTQVGANVDIGLQNSGGLRNELLYAGTGGTNTDGVVTYAEAVAVLPFANNLNVVTLNGASLKKVFEQQWQTNPGGTPPSRPYLQLGTSDNVRYTFDATRPEGDRITGIWIDDERVTPEASYDVAVPSFLAAGGDNFRAFREGVNRDTGLADFDAWTSYLQDNQPLSPSFARHAVQVQGLKARYGTEAPIAFTLPKLNLTSLSTPPARSVTSRLLKDGQVVKNLGSTAVVDGVANIRATAPDVTGSMILEVRSFPNGTRATFPVTIVQSAPVTATAADAVFGEDATVEVDVTAPSGTATGDVTVYSGTTEVGTGTLAQGSASVTVDTEPLGAGTTALRVVYEGDETFPESETTVELEVAKAPTTATVEIAPNARRGAPVDVDVTVASGTGTSPTGTVTLKDGDTTLDSAPVQEGVASFALDTDDLPIGTTRLTVEYAGDDDHVASSTTADLDLAKGVPTLTATAPQAYPYGTSGVLQVSTDDESARGLVFAADGTRVVGVGVLVDGEGEIVLDRTALTPGSHELQVLYNGSTDLEPVETTVTVQVTKAATTTSAYVATSKIVKGSTRAVVYTAVRADGFTVSGGTVVAKVGSVTVGTGTVGANGRVNLTLRPFSTNGTKNLDVTFQGNDLAQTSTVRTTLRVVNR